jgi:hypothetical protein
MNKGYAFGFLIVLLVLILGCYVAYTGFASNLDALRAEPTRPSSSTEVAAEITFAPATPVLTATAVITSAIPTPIAAITVTLTAVGPPEGTEVLTATTPPQAAPTEAQPSEPAETATPEPQPPTPVPVPAYEFRLAGPPALDSSFPNCCYLFGTVRDAAGTGLEGVRVVAFNEWVALDPAVTKGGAEAGRYDIPIGYDAVTWDLILVDAAGIQISTKVSLPFNPEETNAYRIDWQRTY